VTDERKPLRLPISLACATVALALAASGCGDDDGPPADASPPSDSAMADAGPDPDGGPDTGLPVA
jgi:hypothetical protein